MRTDPGNRMAHVSRHAAERPLFLLVVIVSALTWLLLAITVIGLVYALFIAVFFFISHLLFVSHVRGSAVKLGPHQFPDLYARVVALASDMGMEVPTVYIMQAGGALNAFATRFLRREMVILYSDLLEACEGNEGARDMIVAHELAHLKCNHLRWLWFTLPGHFMPFLGSALSRAREYTCDRYGVAGAGDVTSAKLGLVILAAGPRLAPSVDQSEFIRQRVDLNTGLMTIGEWFGSHPPLAKRVAAIDPGNADPSYSPTKGRVLAVTTLLLLAAVGTGVTVAAVVFGGALLDELSELDSEGYLDTTSTPPGGPEEMEDARMKVHGDFEELRTLIARHWGGGLAPPALSEVRDQWETDRPDVDFPIDPFDGYEYGYLAVGSSYEFYSSGSDGEAGTDDDIQIVVDLRRDTTGGSNVR